MANRKLPGFIDARTDPFIGGYRTGWPVDILGHRVGRPEPAFGIQQPNWATTVTQSAGRRARDSLIGDAVTRTLVTQGRDDCGINTGPLQTDEPLPTHREPGFHARIRGFVNRVLDKSPDTHDTILAPNPRPSTAEWAAIEGVHFEPKRGAARERLVNYHQ